MQLIKIFKQNLLKNSSQNLILCQKKLNQNLTKKFASKQENSDEEKPPEVESDPDQNLSEGEATENGEKKNTTAQVIQNVALDSFSRIQIMQKESQTLEEKFPVKIFQTLKNFTEISSNKDIRNMGQSDEQRYIRARISNIFKKQQDMSPQHLVHLVQQFFIDSFAKEQYQIIGDKDFKTIIYNKNFQKVIPLLYKKKFFLENSNFINNQEFSNIVQKCNESSDFFNILELLKYHRAFLGQNINVNNQSQNFSRGLKLNFNEQQQLLEFLTQVQKQANDLEPKQFDVLSCYYHFSVLYSTNIMATLSTDSFVKELSNVIFGDAWKKQEIEQFRHNLHDLLYIHYQIGINNNMKLFLCDLFFSQESYQKSLTAFSLLTLILQRLYQKQSNISDLLNMFKNTLGQEKYDFYIKTHLTQILGTYSNQQRLQTFQQGLNLYDQQLQNGVNEFKILETNMTYFDQHFYNSKNKQIFYNFSNVNLTEIYTYNLQNSNTQSIIQEQDPQEQKNLDQQYDQISLNKFQPFIKNNKVEILKQIQQDLKFHGQLQSLYSYEDLEQNKNNEEYLNNLLSQAYQMIQDYNAFEHFNIKRFLERKNLPYHGGIKYQFSTNNKQQNDFRLSEPYFLTKEENIFYFKPKFFYTSNNKIEDLENDLKTQEITDQLDEHQSDNNNIQKKQNFSNVNPQQGQKQKNAFKQFIEKSQEIDTKQKTKPFVSQEEIEKFKGLQENDSANNNNKGKQRKSRKNPFVGGINQDQKKNTNAISVQKVQSIPLVDFGYFSDLISNQEDAISLINIQKRFLELTNDNDRYSIIGGFLKLKYLNKQIQIESTAEENQIQINGSKAFNKIFHQPSLFTQTSIENPLQLNKQRLTYNYQSQNDEQQIDFYSQDYLKATVFPYQIPDSGITQLVEYQNQVFNRKQFKRILTHILQFNTHISTQNITDIVQICKSKRLPDTLWEFSTVLINNKIEISQEGFQQLISGLCNFKDMQQKIMDLVLLAHKNYEWTVKIDLIQPYLDEVFKFSEESERVVSIFNQLKKIIYSNKVQYDEKLSSDENIKLQEEQKVKNKMSALELYRNSIQFMNERRQFAIGQTIFNDMIQQKYELQEQDYINGLKVNQQDSKQVFALYDQAKKEPKLEFTDKYLECVLNIISANLTEYGKDFFEQIQKELIMSGKIDLTVRLTNMTIGIYSRTKDYNGFGNLLNFMVKNFVRTNGTTKSLCFRIVNESTEELSKGFLKGMIGDLFSLEQIEKTKEKEKEEAIKNPEKYKKIREEYELYLKEKQARQQSQNQEKLSQQQKENKKIQEQKEQLERERQKEQDQKQKAILQQKIESEKHEIKIIKEDIENIPFLKIKQEQQAEELKKLATGPKQKRKIVKNAGYEKYESTQTYIEEGDPEATPV